MIKVAKRAISAVLLNADVTDEELQTVFIGVESLMNSRPLTTLSGDPNDEPVLTPNLFLIGQIGGELTLQSSQSLDASPGTHSSCVASMDAGVLAADWLQTEVVLSDGEFEERRCCACDKSCMMPYNANGYELGRIGATYPGRDGLVRVVDVLSEGKVVRRPVNRISPLDRRLNRTDAEEETPQWICGLTLEASKKTE